MRRSASNRNQPSSCFWFVLLRLLISIIWSTVIDNSRGVLSFPAHTLAWKYDWSIGWLCLLWLATLITWVLKRNSIQSRVLCQIVVEKLFFCSQWFWNEVHRRISMPNLFSGFSHTYLSHCLPAVSDFSQICLENLLNLLKTPLWFVSRETGNKQLENCNRANTIIASRLPTCIDVVLFTVLRGNITWIIKHLGSTSEGLGWWVTLTPSELEIYQVIRHQGRNETWTIFSTCLGSFSCFVIKPITLLSFSTESEYLIFYCQLDISVIRKKRLMRMFFSQAVRSHV